MIRAAFSNGREDFLLGEPSFGRMTCIHHSSEFQPSQFKLSPFGLSLIVLFRATAIILKRTRVSNCQAALEVHSKGADLIATEEALVRTLCLKHITYDDLTQFRKIVTLWRHIPCTKLSLETPAHYRSSECSLTEGKSSIRANISENFRPKKLPPFRRSLPEPKEKTSQLREFSQKCLTLFVVVSSLLSINNAVRHLEILSSCQRSPRNVFKTILISTSLLTFL